MNEILLKSENLYFKRRHVSEFSDWQKKKRACVVRATSPSQKWMMTGNLGKTVILHFPTIHIYRSLLLSFPQPTINQSLLLDPFPVLGPFFCFPKMG
jgi:hypothetical protein